MQYIGLFAAALGFEFAYVAWAQAASRGRPAVTALWSVLTAGLGLVGLRGALELELGWAVYLAAIGLGAYSSAWFGRHRAAGA